MKRLIVYDLDGTLVDTQEDIAQAVNYALESLRAPARPADEIRRFVGWGLRELMATCLATTDPSLIDRGVALFEACYRQHLLDHSRLYPGGRDALEHFKDRHQAVLTNKPNPFACDLLEGLGVGRYFVEIIAGNSGYPKKPDPTSLLALMERLGVSAAHTILVGDSPIDIQTGRRAKVLTIVVSHGFSDEQALQAAQPDAQVKDFDALLELARSRGWS